MAEIKIPFSVTRELAPPFVLDEDYNLPSGVKSVLLDKSKLQVVMKRELVDVPDVGEVEMCLFYLIGCVEYICNAFPIVQSERGFDVTQHNATFNVDNPSSDCVTTTTSDVLGWLSASGCVFVDEVVGGCCAVPLPTPTIESVVVEDLAVANNLTSNMSPLCRNSCGEQGKRVVKWRGCIVVTTT